MMLISLSILEYERELLHHLDDLTRSKAFSQIIRLIQTGKIHAVHVDVMRPPMIPDKTTFPVDLIEKVYGELHERIPLVVHLMVEEPFLIVSKINEFADEKERRKMTIIIQVESFGSEEETVKALNRLRRCGYDAGICLNLPTARETLTPKIVESVDVVLLMSVPMGRGGQEYSQEATDRICYFSRMFPGKALQVDGGIDQQTIAIAAEAGAKIAVVGSFITRADDPVKAILELERSLRDDRSV